MNSKIINIITCSAAMAVDVVSSIFFFTIIGASCAEAILPYCVIVAIIYTALLISERKKIVLMKWVMSLPFSILCFGYFWKTNYAVRALNWVIKDYGRQSAGGNFTGFIGLVILLFLLLTGIAAANIKSSEKIKKYTDTQTLAGFLIGVLNIVVVISLETQFPSYDYVLG